MATQATKATTSKASKGAAAKKAAPAKPKPAVAAKKNPPSKTTKSATPAKALAATKTSTPNKASMPAKNAPATKASTTAVAVPKVVKAPAKKAVPPTVSQAKASAKKLNTAPAVAAPAPKTPKKPPKTNGDLSENNLPSETELLRMSEDEYMNERQLGFFRDRLRQLEQDILNNAGATTEHLRETQFVPDPADRATIEEEHALELRTRDRERKLLKKVQQSILRIDSGEYGWCDETGEPIGLRRLLARPTATLSLEAQERREMRQKMFGD